MNGDAGPRSQPEDQGFRQAERPSCRVPVEMAIGAGPYPGFLPDIPPSGTGDPAQDSPEERWPDGWTERSAGRLDRCRAPDPGDRLRPTPRGDRRRPQRHAGSQMASRRVLAEGPLPGRGLVERASSPHRVRTLPETLVTRRRAVASREPDRLNTRPERVHARERTRRHRLAGAPSNPCRVRRSGRGGSGGCELRGSHSSAPPRRPDARGGAAKENTAPRLRA